jgi:class 3 adenylate cyclase/pSer/pThr/pTyr-binding forkhead associated (FHA) protein
MPPYLVYGYKTNKQKIHELQLGINKIGRAEDNSIVIKNKNVSRYHAEIEVKKKFWTIRDLNSRNFTFVNQIKINEIKLKDKDEIRFTTEKFIFFVNKESMKQISSGTLSIPKNINDSKTMRKELFLDTDQFEIKSFFSDQDQISGSVLKLTQQSVYQRNLDKLKVLLQVSKALSSPQSLNKLLNKILNLLFEIIKVDRAAILLLNEEKKKLECKAFKTELKINEKEPFYSSQIINWVYKNAKILATADASADTRFQSSDSILEQKIHASMCIPLKPKDVVIGVLYLDNLYIGAIYSDEDIEFVSALANQAAIAIDNTRLYERIESEAVFRAKLELFFPTSVRKRLQESDQLEIIEREVTVLFADITGFTELSSYKKPREIIELLNEYFNVVVEDIVFKHEGTLEKYIGDALLAVWGVPYQQPDDPYRALISAIEMQQAVQKLNKNWQKKRNLEIKIHIGLNTGRVAAGNIGSKKLIQYATIGDTTNVSSRICNVAKADEIVISESTFNQLNIPDLPITKMPLVKVKGKSEPLQLYLIHWKNYKL